MFVRYLCIKKVEHICYRTTCSTFMIRCTWQPAGLKARLLPHRGGHAIPLCDTHASMMREKLNRTQVATPVAASISPESVMFGVHNILFPPLQPPICWMRFSSSLEQRKTALCVHMSPFCIFMVLFYFFPVYRWFFSSCFPLRSFTPLRVCLTHRMLGPLFSFR
jgi:hypothetical protein